MIHITVVLPASAAIIIAAGEGCWLGGDASARSMHTADIWAVGFLVAFFLPLL